MPAASVSPRPNSSKVVRLAVRARHLARQPTTDKRRRHAPRGPRCRMQVPRLMAALHVVPLDPALCQPLRGPFGPIWAAQLAHAGPGPIAGLRSTIPAQAGYWPSSASSCQPRSSHGPHCWSRLVPNSSLDPVISFCPQLDGVEFSQPRENDGGPLTGGPFSYQVFVIGPCGHVVGPLRPPLSLSYKRRRLYPPDGGTTMKLRRSLSFR